MTTTTDIYTSIAAAIRARGQDWAGLDWETDLTTRSADDLGLSEAEHAADVAAEAAAIESAADAWQALVEQAAQAAERGDLIACADRLREAGRAEAEYGDDPITQSIYQEIGEAIGHSGASVRQIAAALRELPAAIAAAEADASVGWDDRRLAVDAIAEDDGRAEAEASWQVVVYELQLGPVAAAIGGENWLPRRMAATAALAAQASTANRSAPT